MCKTLTWAWMAASGAAKQRRYSSRVSELRDDKKEKWRKQRRKVQKMSNTRRTTIRSLDDHHDHPRRTRNLVLVMYVLIRVAGYVPLPLPPTPQLVADSIS